MLFVKIFMIIEIYTLTRTDYYNSSKWHTLIYEDMHFIKFSSLENFNLMEDFNEIFTNKHLHEFPCTIILSFVQIFLQWMDSRVVMNTFYIDIWNSLLLDYNFPI